MKETRVHLPEDKLRWWGEGEWVDEPDLVNFEYKGHECVITRQAVQEPYIKEECVAGGFLCGYVSVPESHPYRGLDYGDMNIDCHGGLTFSDAGFIGFDCTHSGDLNPSLEKFKRENVECQRRQVEMIEHFPNCRHLFEDTYRNIDFCVEECKSIVDQLIAMSEAKV